MISTFREIEHWRQGLFVLVRESLEGFPLLLTAANAQIQAYDRVLNLLVMDHPCNMCEGEKLIMEHVDSYNSSRMVYSTCSICESTGVCPDA